MRILTSLALFAIITLVGCSNNATTANTSPNTAPTNSDIEQMVKNRLASDSGTQDARIDVNVDTDKNQVALSGRVYTEAARTRAVEIAKSAKPDLQVVDKIEVKPGDIPRTAYTEDMARDERAKAQTDGDKIGTSLDDAWIHTKIAAKLVADSATPARKINIDVVNGVVTLRGRVDNNEAKREAGRIAKETDGVKSVNNLLRAAVG